MRIYVEFLGFPTVSDVVGKKHLELDVSGNTFKDVIDELIRMYGRKVRDAFYDEKGNLDVTLQLTLNGKILSSADTRQILLNEGDRLTFMLLLAGG